MAFGCALFDLDGTLMDSAACVVLATRAAFVECGLPAPEEERVRGLLGVPVERSFVEMGAGSGTATVIATFRARYVELAPRHVRAFEGVTEMLEELRRRGVVSVVVTSKKRSIAEADCRSAGIAELLAGVVGSDCVQRYKPDPQTALVAMERHGIDAKAAVVIGDAVVDLRMGRAAGVRTCAALWDAHDRAALVAERPDLAIERPGELLKVF